MPAKKAVTHQSFLLRCWQERPAAPDQRPVWRFMLQDVLAGRQQHSFATFEQMVAFLGREFMEIPPDRDETNRQGDRY